MTDCFIDALTAQEINVWNSAFKLIVSMLLGSAVGLERKRKGQPAGLRTFALISMGATLAMILSIYVPQEYLGLKNGDPGRIAAQVITGIGFLGAGAIIQMKGSVRGLTTAAGIWMVATIGMSIGVGMYAIGVLATILVLFVLMLLERIEHRVHVGADTRTVRLRIEGIITDIAPYDKVIQKYHAFLSNYFVEYDYETSTTRLNLFLLLKEDADYMTLLENISKVNKTLAISLGREASIN